jgi:hypothetical protein
MKTTADAQPKERTVVATVVAHTITTTSSTTNGRSIAGHSRLNHSEPLQPRPPRQHRHALRRIHHRHAEVDQLKDDSGSIRR